ncbi:MAG: putative selenate reductase subunit YgfK [Ignavibacteria bacterium]|nr:putative selenate reductase subunit YgfK [Ignavibacteria bacterium]
MAQKMQTISFEKLLNWIFTELKNSNQIFGIPAVKFYKHRGNASIEIFNEKLDNPFGLAAGPHTQLAQNIIVSYLVGGRFMELKTVQKLDNLEIEKPCIDVEDEGYNVEWSQELSLEKSFDEYLKSWIIIHLLKETLGLSSPDSVGAERGFIFNMSVGYDLEGIKTERMDKFIDYLIDANNSTLFRSYIKLLNESLSRFELISKKFSASEIEKIIENISPNFSNSVTLSTMHGSPPHEIEAIAKYLIKEKNLHTYVKLNPTLLGFEFVTDVLHKLGFDYIKLNEKSFENDLQFNDAIPMLNRLKQFAKIHGKEIGVKLSNTLGVHNSLHKLPGNEMYMSGRSLFPLTINLAYKLAEEFKGDLNISFSGGATVHNSQQIFETGIYPITLVTDLLKPGGYERLHQIASNFTDPNASIEPSCKIKLSKLKSLAEVSLQEKIYNKHSREIKSLKLSSRLEKFDCYVAPCELACPIHQDVSKYIRLIEENRYDDAFKVIIEKNPLPHITGYICDHQCMYKCVRWDYDDPLLIRDLKKKATEEAYDKFKDLNIKRLKDKGSAAIIGGGPSGLSAAYFLARAGLDVTIFEKTNRAGGVVRHSIPGFRIPQEVIDKDIELVKKFGVNFVFGSDESMSIKKLKDDGFKYIYLAIGAGKSKKFELSGENKNVFSAIDFLQKFNRNEKLSLGNSVAVIGGGNSAMDGARAALRCERVEKVFIIYRRTKEFMPADKEELDAALDDGVIFKKLLLPVEFNKRILKCQKMQLGEFDKSGRRRVVPIENEFEEIEIDSVITAIGEEVDYDFLTQNGIKIDERKNILVNNTTNETLIENVFIGGDAFRGPSTVVESIADGKKAAESILAKERIDNQFNLSQKVQIDGLKWTEDLSNRKGIIEFQNSIDYSSESSRCLGCDQVCNKCVEVCPNRANIAIAVNGEFKDKFQILHIDGMCNECGNCETFCPHQGAPYKDKLTLFWNEEEFDKSQNDGFYLQTKENEVFTFKLRCNTKVDLITMSANDDKYNTNDKSQSVMHKVINDHGYLL